MMYFLLNIGILNCHVTLPKGTVSVWSIVFTVIDSVFDPSRDYRYISHLAKENSHLQKCQMFWKGILRVSSIPFRFWFSASDITQPLMPRILPYQRPAKRRWQWPAVLKSLNLAKPEGSQRVMEILLSGWIDVFVLIYIIYLYICKYEYKYKHN